VVVHTPVVYFGFGIWNLESGIDQRPMVPLLPAEFPMPIYATLQSNRLCVHAGKKSFAGFFAMRLAVVF
jgi:hypothetical protein